MFRRCYYPVAGAVTLLWVLGSPGLLDAQTRLKFPVAKARPPLGMPGLTHPPLHKPPIHKDHAFDHFKGHTFDPKGHAFDHLKGHTFDAKGHAFDHLKGHTFDAKGHVFDHLKGHTFDAKGHAFDHLKGSAFDHLRRDKRKFPGTVRPELLTSFQWQSFVNPWTSNIVTAGGIPSMPGIVTGGGGIPNMPGYTSGSIPAADPGSADVMRAYADLLKADQEARIRSEEAKWMGLETIKKRAETELYIKSITPNWTEKQAKIANNVLARARITTNPNEISSGNSLNILLNDLRKVLGRKVASNSIYLSEEILENINVTAKSGNLGLLRNGGTFTWPRALTVQGMVSQEDRKDIEDKAQVLVQEACSNNVPRKTLAELKKFLNGTAEKLAQRVDDIPAGQYLEGKRFLNHFTAACLALENGEAPAYFKFRKWSSGGKTIQDVVDYLVKEGLQFAAAVPGDEGAYRAIHSALAAYDLEISRPVSMSTNK
jgi:hypothetical protein